MKNSTIGKINTSKTGYPRSRFNLSHDVNTTFSWSDVQPLVCRAMQPDSKAVVGVESLVRLAPMVAPTFGDARFKTWHEFVAMSDLTDNYDALMSRTRVNRGNNSFVPRYLPRVSIFDLSCMCLIGSSCTIYRCLDGAKFGAGHAWMTYNNVTDMDTLMNLLASDSGHNIQDIVQSTWAAGSPFAPATDYYAFNPLILLPEVAASSFRAGVYIPVNRGRNTIGNNPNSSFGFGSVSNNGGDITIEGADIVVIREFNGHGFAFAFRLSDFGKRIRKALIGAGYQINFDLNGVMVSLMPLFAMHKAWYELFGLTLFENYEDTFANRMLRSYDNYNVFDFTLSTAQLTPYLWMFFGFMLELGNMWYTEKTDFVNAHTANITSNVKEAGVGNFIEFDGASDNLTNVSHNIYSPRDAGGISESDVGKDAHWRTITQNHGELDAELLKKLYKFTNRNSVVGQRVRDLLIQQGLADYVDECEPRFIGYDDTHIQIYDVVSDADTFNPASPDSGKLLGEYAGRGLQPVDSKNFTYEAKEYGWYIVLASVVPLAGYAQGVDANVTSIDKTTFYNPEFDGLGMDASPKFLVCGDEPISNPVPDGNKTLVGNFGFIPRYSALKVAGNKINGDFSLRSHRDSYLPYTLDRIFEVNEKRVTTVDASSYRSSIMYEKFDVANFPIAGNMWRYVGRYPFMANSNRIFANVGSPYKALDDDSMQLDLSRELGVTQSDNFMVHNVVHFDYFAPMLPIEDSFETKEEGNEGKANSSVEKA